jgi:AraC-like DNA-binding protein
LDGSDISAAACSQRLAATPRARDSDGMWLARFVEAVEELAADGDRPLDLVRLPDGRTTLVFRAFAGGGGDLTIVGPRTRAVFKTAHGVARIVVVRFKPGWSTLLGVRASELTERYVPLDELWGRAADDLCGDLLAAPDTPTALALISDAFARRSGAAEPASASLARRGARLLEGDHARVDHVAQRLGVTARHLRRAFADSIGLAPKDFARVVRLQRAVRRAHASRDWGRIASDAGYYDQAHLIGDFRDLVGITPVELANRLAAHPHPA